MPRGIEFDTAVIRAVFPSEPVSVTPWVKFLDQKAGEIGNTRILGQELARIFIEQEKSRMQLPEEDFEKENERIVCLLRTKYGIDYDREVENCRRAMNRCVRSLCLPDEAKVIILKNLAEAVFDNRSSGVSLMQDPATGKLTVRISPSIMYWEVESAQGLFGGRLDRQTITAAIAGYAGHEMGHGISLCFSSPDESREDPVPSQYGNDYMGDYPIKYRDGNEELEAIANLVKSERFAAFFEWNLVTGMGLNYDQAANNKRLEIYNIYGEAVFPQEMATIFRYAIEYVDRERLRGNQEVLRRVGYQLQTLLFCYIYANKHLATLFPFGRRAVEDILNKAWKEFEPCN